MGESADALYGDDDPAEKAASLIAQAIEPEVRSDDVKIAGFSFGALVGASLLSELTKDSQRPRAKMLYVDNPTQATDAVTGASVFAKPVEQKVHSFLTTVSSNSPLAAIRASYLDLLRTLEEHSSALPLSTALAESGVFKGIGFFPREERCNPLDTAKIMSAYIKGWNVQPLQVASQREIVFMVGEKNQLFDTQWAKAAEDAGFEVVRFKKSGHDLMYREYLKFVFHFNRFLYS